MERTEKFPLTLDNCLGRAVTETRRMEALGPLSCLWEQSHEQTLTSFFSLVKYLAMLREYVPMVSDPTIIAAVDSLQTDALTVLPFCCAPPGGPAFRRSGF